MQRDRKILLLHGEARDGDVDNPEADCFCLTWTKITVWPLTRRLSAAHLRAIWLPLSLSMATATNRVIGFIRSAEFAGGGHILFFLTYLNLI